MQQVDVWVAVNYEGAAAFIAPGFDTSHRRMRKHMAFANRTGLEYWHDFFLPLRFNAGNKKYNHKKRKDPYLYIKRERGLGKAVRGRGGWETDKVYKGGLVDLVRTGKTERKAEAASPIASYAYRATLMIAVPYYASGKPQADKPDLASEITTTPASEREVIRVVVSRNFMSSLKRDQAYFTKRL